MARIYPSVVMLSLLLFSSASAWSQVGIGTTIPSTTTRLDVINPSTSSFSTAVRGTGGTAPSVTYSIHSGIYGQSANGVGLLGVSDGNSGVLGSSTNSDGVEGITTGGGNGVYGWSNGSGAAVRGEMNGAGTAGYFNGGTTGKGLLVPNGMSAFGLQPSSAGAYNRLSVIQPAISTGIDTNAAIYGSAGTQFACMKGGVFGTYNFANSGTGVQGLGFGGVNNRESNSFIVGSRDVGVYGSAGSVGVHGTSVSGIGVLGWTKDNTTFSTEAGVTGVGAGTGVYGDATTAFTGIGAPVSKCGVLGRASGGTNSSYGVYGTATVGSGSFATGVSGNVNGVWAGINTAVQGSAIGANTNYGLYGFASGFNNTGTSYGVYAIANSAATNWAGWFQGNVNISGSIAKGSGTFKIDHPLDPENKYLYHSFVESPDMMNVYNGNAILDAQGQAIVQLPEYFEALNKDFRYQLTPIGAPAQLYVAEEISGNHFRIAGGSAGMKVSWQVTGVRKDRYAEAHRVKPEVEKESQFKGYYIHAAEWGQPESRSIGSLTTAPKQPTPPAEPEASSLRRTRR